MDGQISENVNANPKRKFMIIILGVSLFFIALLIALWKWGSQGIAKVLMGMMVIIIIFSIIGIIFVLIVKLIFPPKPNMIAIVNKRIVQSAEMREPDVLTKVFLRGDDKDYEKKYLGELKGISEGIIPPRYVKEQKGKAKDGTPIFVQSLAEPMKRILFLVVKKSVFNKKIIGVLRDDITNPSMNEVYIQDTALGLPFGNIFFPRKYSGNSNITMMPLGEMVKNYTLEGLLRDFKVIIDDAIQSNPSHQKNLEQKGVMERIGEVGEHGN